MIRLFGVVGLLLLLSACGFHLRGTGNSKAFAMPELNVRAQDVFGDSQKLLRKMLANYKVKITETAPYTLNLIHESNSRRAVSQTSSSRAAEYEQIGLMDYEILGRTGAVLLREHTEVRKVYVYDANNLIGTDQEATIVRQELRSELVQQVFMRLQRVTSEQLVQWQKEADAKAQAEAAALEAARKAADAEANQPQYSPVEPATR